MKSQNKTSNINVRLHFLLALHVMELFNMSEELGITVSRPLPQTRLNVTTVTDSRVVSRVSHGERRQFFSKANTSVGSPRHVIYTQYKTETNRDIEKRSWRSFTYI